MRLIATDAGHALAIGRMLRAYRYGGLRVAPDATLEQLPAIRVRPMRTGKEN